MKRQGCEIEAIGINYTIYTHKRVNPFEFFTKKTSINQQDVEVASSSTSRVRHVLKGVDCRAKPWEILAIVGPSGAGKSSLLEILAGKVTPQSASIYVNQKPIHKAKFKKISGYVTQKDTLFPLLTVEETLMFSAKLRLGLPQKQLSTRVKSLIQELGLGHVAGARVGDDRVRGISGGERRRVSIGVEVVHEPKVVILDEPTSGLDSNSALQIIDMLKTMAETKGRTIILSIHQPGFRIVKLFNSILLLANGMVLHHGTVDQLGLHLQQMGLTSPLHVNVVEFAIDSTDSLIHHHQPLQNDVQNRPKEEAGGGRRFRPHHRASKCLLALGSERSMAGPDDMQEQQHPEKMDDEGESRSGRFTLQQLFQQSKVIDEDTITTHFKVGFHRGFANSRFTETLILTHRFSKNIFRTKELFACRTLQMLVAGLILGSIFYDLNDDLKGAEEKVGLFAFILTFLLSSTIEALPIFLQEREILMKETSSGSYRVSSYALANGLVYLPFLLILAILFSVPLYWLVGLHKSFMAFIHFLLLIWLILYTANSVVVCLCALVPNFIVGNSVISGVMGSFFLFSGYFISNHSIPGYWIFMHYVSLFKYPFEGFLINEFSGSKRCFQNMFGKCVLSGEDVLREEGYGKGGRWKNIVVMVCFILVYRFISYVILRFRCSQKGLRGALL